MLKVARDDIHEQGPPPAGQHHVFQKVQNDRLVRILLLMTALPSDEHYLAVQRAEDAAGERLVPCLVLLLQSVVLQAKRVLERVLKRVLKRQGTHL